MATCQTTRWGDNYSPIVKLTVTESSSTATTVTLSYTLQYITDYKAYTNGNGRAYSIVIDGTTVKSGTYDINQVTGTKTITSGTATVNKSTSSRKVSFSCSFTFDVTWNGTYSGTRSASGSISIGAKTSYTVSYNANGGSGAPSAQTKWHGTALTLSSATPTRVGYTFAGWATSSTGSVAYAAGASYTSNSSVTLYAKWTPNTYTVSYNANGGSGAPSAQTKTYGINLTLSSTKPTRSGYNFLGWSTTSGGGVVYNAGGTYTENAAITLYAVWSVAYRKPTISNLTFARCNSDGTLNASGNYASFSFNWSTYYAVSSIQIHYKKPTGSWYSMSVHNGGTGETSGTIRNMITADIESSYSFYVTVSDSGGSTDSRTLTLSSQLYPIDVLYNGNGVAIGKVAESAGIFDINFTSQFNKPIVGNCNDSGQIQFGYSEAGAAYSYINSGSGNYNFVIRNANTGGWARGLFWEKEDGTVLGTLGGYGNGNALSEIHIGTAYNNTWMEVTSNGSKIKGGWPVLTLQRLGPNFAGIKFVNSNGDLGYLSMSTANGKLIRSSADGMTDYNVIDSAGGTINGYLHINNQYSVVTFMRFAGEWIGFYASSDNANGNTSRKGWLGHNFSTVFTITNEAGGGLKCSSAWTVSSDERLKKNIENIPPVFIDIWKELMPKTFEWNELNYGNGKKQFGLIAQDVIEVFGKHGVDYKEYDFILSSPRGTEGDETEYFSLSYDHYQMLTALVVKEQQKEIDTLKNEVAELKDLVKQLLTK